MIFVTVGTHEQPFNRLIKEIDRLVETGIIKDEVFIQTGYSTYEPKFCKWSSLISFDKMNELMQTSDIIITHGGPATFMSAIANGKKPIVVPRQEKYGEHVNDHQIDFCEKVNSRFNNIYLVNNTNELRKLLTSDISFKTLNGSKGNTNFISNFTKEINSLVGKD